MRCGEELKALLSSFIERETVQDYDRDAEQALQRLASGEVDLHQLTDAWAKSYSEVHTHTHTHTHMHTRGV